ncbi:MAG: hypothetical protein ACHQAV_00490 [Solirubrobacterales bacterium]
MRRIRIMGLCLVAAFTMSAIATASASAAPEFFGINTCTKKFEQMWNGGTCPKTGKVLAATKDVYSTKGSTSKLEGGIKIECSSDESKGDTEGSKKIVKLKLTYHGCHETGTETPCQTSQATLKVIKTEAIKGELTEASETSGGTLAVVQRLEPEKVLFTKFLCGLTGHTIKVEVKGKIFIGIEPVQLAPLESALSLTGTSFNKEKSPVAGCGNQQFLYEVGKVTCDHLKVVENGAELEPSWNISEDAITYKTKIEVVQ